MKNTFLVITSIANDQNVILKKIAEETLKRKLSFIVVGDTKSPENFNLRGCDFYSVDRQKSLPFKLAENLPYKHYSRKNLGYLIAMSKGAEKIIETDDDNIPLEDFWNLRSRDANAHLLQNEGWVNVYRYFTQHNIWPRGFPLENLKNPLPRPGKESLIKCPIQQGLADDNPDVDAIYRLTMPLPVTFNKSPNIALGNNSFCPFNSQNTTWFKEAFPLLYLPSYCSFRMTDIWRSLVAQRISWTCGWPVLFHHSTVRQERNDHNLMEDFRDEMEGYIQNKNIGSLLEALELKDGVENIFYNMKICYKELVNSGYIGPSEMNLLESWLQDVQKNSL